MACLLNLPNETLCQVIDNVDISDIESFGASCKTVHLLAKAAVLKHRKFKKEYSTLQLGSCQAFNGDHPFYLLRDIIRNPTIGLYPTILHLGEFTFWTAFYLDYPVEWEEVKVVKRSVGECEGGLRQTLADVACIESTEVDEWYDLVAKADTGATYALLLTLLPNLRSLNFEGESDGFFDKILDRMTHPYSTGQVNKTRFLGHLSHVIIPTCNNCYSHVGNLCMDTLRPFTALPSLRRISGSSIRSGYGPSVPDNDVQSPGIVEVDVDRSIIFEKSLRDLLVLIKDLQRFRLHLGGHRDDYYNHEPRKVVLALREHAGHSLEYLHLTGSWIGMRRFGDEVANCDLRKFAKLREIVVDYTLFQYELASCFRCEGYIRRNCQCHYSRPLVDILPTSIESVKLVGKISVKRALATLENFGELKAERLPNLRKVMMNSAIVEEQDVVKTCRKVGVALIVSDTAREEEDRQRFNGAEEVD